MAPLAVLAFWAFVYLRELARVIEAPGVPLKFAYRAKGGVVDVSAADYSLDFGHGRIEVDRLRVSDKLGPIATVNRLEATGLRPRQLGDQIITIRAFGVTGTITRLATGRFDLEQDLPEHKGPPSTVPFSILIDQAQVTFLDLMGPAPWRESASTRRLRVAGIGDDWVASADAQADGVGAFPIRLQNESGVGLHAETFANGAEVAPLLAHLLQTPPLKRRELQGLSASSVRVYGPVKVLVPKQGRPKVEARVSVQSVGVRFRGYAVDRATFRGVATANGSRGVVEAVTGPNRLRFDGSAAWLGGVLAAGRAEAWSPSSATLPPWARKILPAKTGFEGAHFSGWAAYGPGKSYRAQGDVSIAEARYGIDAVSEVTARVSLDPKSLVAELHSAKYQGEVVGGAAALDLRTRSLSGGGQAKHLDLGRISRRLGLKELSGIASATAVVGGNLERPVVDLEARGTARYVRGKQDIAGSFIVAARYEGRALDLRRAVAEGPFGLVEAAGSIGSSGVVGIRVTGRDLNPTIVVSNLTGSANLEAQVSGTLSDPRAAGTIEGYGLSIRDYSVPVVASDFTADRHHIVFPNVRATRGPTEITGDAALTFADQSMRGFFALKGLQVADLLGEAFAGTVDVSDAVIGGTMSAPTLAALLAGHNVVAQGIEVESLSARLNFDGKIAKVEDAVAQLAGGDAKGAAQFDLEREVGSADVTLAGIDLQQVVPKLSTAVAVAGVVGGAVHADLDKAGIRSATAGGRFEGVAVNETPIGDGPWSMKYAGSEVTGNLQVGSLDSYVSLQGAGYDLRTKQLRGRVDLYNAQVADMVTISTRYLPNLSFEVVDAMRAATGLLDVGGNVKGSLDNPAFEAASVHGANLKYRDVSLGTLSADVSMENRRWNLQDFTLGGGILNVRAGGVVDERGTSDLHVDIGKVSLPDLGRIVPSLGAQTGTATVSLVASGPTRTPDVHASLEAEGLLQRPGGSADQALRVSLVGDLSGADKTLTVGGDYFYRGFQGSATGSADFEYPFSIPKGGKVAASVTLAKRELKEVAGLVGGIDPARTSGTIGGDLHASGTADNLSITGSVSLDAPTFGFELPPAQPKAQPGKLTDSLKNVKATVALADNVLSITAGADSSRGGHVAANLSTPIDELQRLATNIQAGGLRAVLDDKVSGTVTLEKLELRQNYAGNSYVAGTADGKIAIGGTLRRPAISGAIALSKVDSSIPTLPTSTATASTPQIDPSFDLSVSLDGPADLKTIAAEMYVLGSANLSGTLTSPRLQSQFEVQKGTIRLPSSVVRLQPGGSLSVDYQVTSQTPLASANVDMEGKTALTALKYGDIYERYDITIYIKGDLLKDNGLVMTADSDPPDLSQDRILALLGQTDLLSTLNSGTSQSDAEKQWRDALTSFALPALTDSLTAHLAQGLGLDYLSLEYNAFEQASVAFARSLGAGLTVQGRNQIGDPPPGFKPLYDYRVVYSPRHARGILSRLSFSLGSDQDRPYKLAVEYGVKF